MKPKVKQAPKVQDEIKQAPPKVEVPKVEVQAKSTKLQGDQTIIGIGGNLVVDKEYNVSSHTAQVLIDKGFATLKTT